MLNYVLKYEVNSYCKLDSNMENPRNSCMTIQNLSIRDKDNLIKIM